MQTSMMTKTLDHNVHALTGGSGSTLVLLPGWPQTAQAYAEVFPLLSAYHRVLILDPPGLGDSGPSSGGYDTATVSAMLAEAMRGETEQTYHVVGHDVGAWIAYAWAAQFPELVKSLTLLDSAVPGCSAPPNFPLPYEVNLKLWQFSFNALPDLPEILTQGRERELLDWLFDRKSQHPERISPENRAKYVECYSRDGAMSRGFAYYRAVAESAKQNQGFSQRKLSMPVLALGGETAVGDALRQSMEMLALQVQGGVLADCGHYLMEEQPEQLAQKMLAFLGEVDGAGV
jgi:pimeloyl-ACP methyl ester carboxylesterase